MSSKLRKAGFKGGFLSTGPANSITDVPGTRIGHVTLNSGKIQTGVTALIPAEELYVKKLPAACHVINGYGKTAGLVQINELGNIETPIVLTNTFSTGTAFQALVRYMLDGNPGIGIEPCSVNPIVCECNDGYLNDIRGMHIQESHVLEALKSASAEFAAGAVGAGRGMSCHGLKGGIGSSSRLVPVGESTYCLGTLVLTNHAKIEELTIAGRQVGRELAPFAGEDSHFKGSVIVIMATDAPLCSRQLGRLCRRVPSGLARTGSVIASGSGEIAVAYSTKNRIPHYPSEYTLEREYIHEDYLDSFFTAVTETVEEAVLSSLYEAATVRGRNGNIRMGISDLLKDAGISL